MPIHYRKLFVLAAIVLIAPCGFGSVVFVKGDAAGNGTGLSWGDAYTDLQSGLAAALPGDEIWVAAGVYRPGPPGCANDVTFQLRIGVALYGGFAGTEANRQERKASINITTLSGDIEGDDGSGGSSDNAFHVVTAVGMDVSAVLDGFTLTGGIATLNGEDGSGGGILCDGGAPTIQNCVIAGNRAEHDGAGLYRCQGPIRSSVISGNDNHFLGYGGGLYDCDGDITGCTIADNSAYRGGGMYFCDGAIIDCDIHDNFGDESGGGIDVSAGTIRHSRITRNRTGGPGGGLRGCSGVIANCVVSDNRSDSRGGGLVGCDGPVVSCVITENEAVFGGGMADCAGTIANCVVIGNTAPSGGGLYNCDGTIANCTIAENMGRGGLVASNAYVVNTILWANMPDQIVSGSPIVSYSDVEGGCAGIGNIAIDPELVDSSGRLSSTSPCIDAGSNSDVSADLADLNGDGDMGEPTPQDIVGRSRFSDHCIIEDTGAGIAPIVDMGAFEYPRRLVASDSNCDGSVDAFDIQSFVQAIAQNGGCSPCAGDANEDGSINQFDIQAFVEVLCGSR